MMARKLSRQFIFPYQILQSFRGIGSEIHQCRHFCSFSKDGVQQRKHFDFKIAPVEGISVWEGNKRHFQRSL